MERYVVDKGLPWQPVFREWWLGFQRPGRAYVPIVRPYRQKPVTFGIKVQDDPAKLGLEDPYPELEGSWSRTSREWSWRVPSP
jgi:hypothetical protein